MRTIVLVLGVFCFFSSNSDARNELPLSLNYVTETRFPSDVSRKAALTLMAESAGITVPKEASIRASSECESSLLDSKSGACHPIAYDDGGEKHLYSVCFKESRIGIVACYEQFVTPQSFNLRRKYDENWRRFQQHRMLAQNLEEFLNQRMLKHSPKRFEFWAAGF